MVIDMFIILIFMVVSWVCIYVLTLYTLHAFHLVSILPHYSCLKTNNKKKLNSLAYKNKFLRAGKTAEWEQLKSAAPS